MATKKTIFDAITSGDAGRVKRFLSRDPEALGDRDEDGLSPVLRALYAGKPDIVELLRLRQPELDVFEAAALGEADTLRRLVGRSKRRAGAFSHDGFTPLHLASYFGHAEAAKLLLEKGADVHARSKNRLLFSIMPLHSAAASRQTELAELLLDHGANPNATQDGGWTALHAAAANGNAELVRLLLARGANPRQQSDDRTPPIEFAIEAGHREVVEVLQRGVGARRSSRR